MLKMKCRYLDENYVKSFTTTTGFPSSKYSRLSDDWASNACGEIQDLPVLGTIYRPTCIG